MTMDWRIVLFNVVWIGGVLFIAFRQMTAEARRQDDEEVAQRKPEAKARAKAAESYRRQYVALPADPRFPTEARDGFALIDAAREAGFLPPKAPLPGLSAKRRIVPGTTVKLWAAIRGDRVAVLAVTNSAVTDDCLSAVLMADGEFDAWSEERREITLHANHIAEIVAGPRDPSHPLN